MTKELIIPDEIIMNQIYYIRGQKVMLDEDLVELYQVTTGKPEQGSRKEHQAFSPGLHV